MFVIRQTMVYSLFDYFLHVYPNVTLQADGSSDIYAHMESTHGGSGAELHELMGEIENDPFIREFIERQNPMLLVGFL